jgi:hypothetical protein
MATEATIQRWDRILDDVEKRRRGCVAPLEMLVPGHIRFEQGFHLVVDAITKAYMDAWQSAPPADGSALHAVLETVADAADGFDFTRPAAPQVDRFMQLVAEARDKLTDDDIAESTPQEVVTDVENLLKVSVLVARVSHRGAMEIADKEQQERSKAINKATDRAPKFLDLNTMLWVEQPSKTTVSLAVFLAMVDPGIATLEEMLRGPDEKDRPPTMKQFAAQWVVNVHTEWEEHYREALATALGCNKENVRSDYFADLGRMRQDYVHKRGICRNSARNKVLKWFKKGDIMTPTHANYLQLLTDFPAEELLTPKPAPAAQRQPVKANADPELVRRFADIADGVGVTKDAALDEALTAWTERHFPVRG